MKTYPQFETLSWLKHLWLYNHFWREPKDNLRIITQMQHFLCEQQAECLLYFMFFFLQMQSILLSGRTAGDLDFSKGWNTAGVIILRYMYAGTIATSVGECFAFAVVLYCANLFNYHFYWENRKYVWCSDWLSVCSKPLAPLKQNKRNKGVLKTFAQYCTWIRLGLDVL